MTVVGRHLHRRRAGAVLAVVAVVLSVATGCSRAVNGNGIPAPVGDVNQVRTADQLARFLMPLPAGAEPGTTAWGRQRTPTIDEFAAQIYTDENPVDGGDYLRDLGVREVAHESWYIPDANGADLSLLLFDTDAEARNWAADEKNSTALVGVRRGKLTSVVTAVGYTFTRRSGDYLDTRYFVVRGRIGIQVDYFNPDEFEPGDIDDWIGTQYALLV